MSVCVIKNILNLDTIQHLFYFASRHKDVVKVVNVESGLFLRFLLLRTFDPVWIKLTLKFWFI